MDIIEVGYACGYVVPVYMDHLGVNLPEWLKDEQDEVCSPKDKLSSVGEVHEKLQSDMDFGIKMDDLEDNIDVGIEIKLDNEPDMDVDNELDDGIRMNKTKNDEFLSKLCLKEQ